MPRTPNVAHVPAAAAPPRPAGALLSIADVAAYLNVSRRSLERLRSAGRLPRPDVRVGKMPRWKPETLLRWVELQGRSR